MSDFAIKVDALSKRYAVRTAVNSEQMELAFANWLKHQQRLGAHILRRLARRTHAPAPKRPAKTREFWALKDVSFTVKQGEVLGILGPNGAGKSTLLKILSEITPPTSGRVEIAGKVGSLLEVGTGFNPELSGHENIYLYGAILGMDRETIRQRYDEIVEFSEISDFLHQPIKHYSSGMHAKLGFSVAAHLDCEILLVDEILSVGDAAFRRKSYSKMTELITIGKTVLFVSHNMSAINNLCTRAMVLNKGEVVFEGETGKAVNHYLDAFGHKTAQSQANPALFPENPDAPVNILSIRVVNSEGKTSSKINYSETFAVEMEILVREPNENYFAAIWLRDTSGQMILFTSDEDLGPAPMGKLQPGRYTTRVEMPARMFVPDSYRLMCALAKKPTGQIDRKDEAIELEIIDNETWRAQQGLYRKTAAIAPELPWTIDEAEGVRSLRSGTR
jgi:lipopolysaccharide transport system ATP-binding protein